MCRDPAAADNFPRDDLDAGSGVEIEILELRRLGLGSWVVI